MSDTTMTRRPRGTDWAMILLVYLISMLGASALSRSGTRVGNVAAAASIAAATAMIAARGRRFVKFPLWSSVTSVAVLGAFAIGSAALWPGIAAWRQLLTGMLWMHPWYFMIFSGSGSGSFVCATTTSRAAGWCLVGGAVAVGVVAPLITTLV